MGLDRCCRCRGCRVRDLGDWSFRGVCNMKLPEMSVIDTHLPSNHKTRAYTVEQMLAWGKACAKSEREACAKLCDAVQQKNEDNGAFMWEAKNSAAAIRARGENT